MNAHCARGVTACAEKFNVLQLMMTSRLCLRRALLLRTALGDITGGVFRPAPHSTAAGSCCVHVPRRRTANTFVHAPPHPA